MSSGTTVLITGAAGFIGRHIARHYHHQGATVVGIDMVSPENAPLSSMSKYVRLTMPDPSLQSALKSIQAEVCIHCSGRASVGASVADPHDDFYTATVVTFELLNALRLSSPKCRFVFVSSAAVYGNPPELPIKESHPANPISPYGFHKLQCEEICREFSRVYGMCTAAGRIFTAYGPGLRRQVIWDICHKALVENRLVLQGTGSETRDFIHAVDIACAIDLLSRSAQEDFFTWNIASGEAVTIASLTKMVTDALGISIQPEFDGIVPPGNPVNWQADIAKLKEAGHSPRVQFAQGVATFANWCKAELLGI